MPKFKLLSFLSALAFIAIIFFTPLSQTYADITTGLVSHWKLDETSGATAFDSSGINNGVINGATPAAGKIGGAFSFDGVNDSVSLPLLNNDEMSFSAWFYKSGTDATGHDSIIGYFKDAPLEQNREGYELTSPPSVWWRINFRLVTKNTSGTKKDLSNSYTLPAVTNVWYHIVTTYNKTTGEQKMYINNQLVDTQIHPINNTIVPLSAYSNMLIGNSTYANGYFKGLIDDVRLYNRTLSASDVAELYNYTGGAQSSSSSSSFPSSSSSLPSSSSSSQSFSSSSSSLTSTDLTPPSVSITSPTSASTYSTTLSTVSLSGTASDNIGVSTITCTNNGVSCGTVSGTTNWSIANAPLIVGTNNIIITARDTANNQSTDTLTVTRNQQTQSASQWQQVPLRTKAQKTASVMGGEGTQNVYTISYAPSNPNIVYNVNDVSQVWKSTDGGSNWAKSHKGFLARGATSVAVSPLNENLVFATGGVMSSALMPQSPAEGIYRSTDGGQNWSLVFPGRYYKIFNGGTHVAFANNGTVYAVTLDGKLAKSTDNGSTWTVIWNPGVRMDDIKTHPTTQNILFVVMPSGLWKVTDNGTDTTAVKIGAGLPRNPASIVIDKQNPNNIYATVYEYKVYKSTDGGLNFSPRSNGISESAGKQATSIAISPVDGNYLYVYFQFTTHLYYSHDGGASWQRPVTTDVANADGYVSGSLEDPNTNTGFGWGTGPIVAHPTDKNIAIATGAFYHMKKTTDGGLNWRYSNSGNTGGAAGNGVASFSFDPQNPNRFAVFLVDYGGYITDDDGSTFRPFLIPMYNDNGNYVRSATAGAIDSLSNSQLIISSNGGWDKQTLAQSTDNGVTWQFSKDSAGNSMNIGYTFINFHPQNPNIIYANRYKGVRNAVTKTITWTGLSNRVEAVFAGNGDHVYGFWDKTIYKSIDAGTTWTVHSTITNTETSAGISALAIDPTNENRMYAVAQTNGLYVWNGTTWIKKGAADGFPKDAFNRYGTMAVAIDPLKPNIIYAANSDQTMGQSNGVFRSMDYGATWENISYNLGPEMNVVALKVNPHNGYIYLGSYHGTWRLPPPGTGGTTSDTTPPVVSVTSPTSASTYSTTASTVNLSGTASDNVGVSTITCTNNGASCGTVTGTTSWSIGNIPLIVGTNNIVLTARDSSSNSNTGMVTLSVTRTTVTSSSSSSIQSSSSSSVSKFAINDRVVSTDNVNVRASASLTGALLGTHTVGSLGYVLSSPMSADGYNWYNVNFDSAPDGWSVDAYLEKTVQQSSSSSSSFVSQTFYSSSYSSNQGTVTAGGGGGSSGGGTIGTVAPLAPYIPQAVIQSPFTPPLLQQSHSTTIPPKKVTGPFSIGMRSNEVKLLQEMLASDTSIYPEGEVTGYYGPSTTQAVKRFQKKHGIEETGLAGIQTRAKLNEVYGQTQSSYQSEPQTITTSSYVFARELSLNSKGNDVTELQKRLTSEGVYSGPITGYYGRLTREAVRKYQARNNLPQVGAVGPRTLNLLNGSTSSSSSTSSPGLSLAQLVELLINLGIISSDKADLARNALKAMGR